MFDIGWTEMLVVGVVALIVIGPKDLPEMFRTLGRFTAKMRGMARDFQRAMDSAADEAGVKDLKNVAGDLKKATSAKSLGLDAVKDAATKFEKWDPMKPAKPAPAAPVVTPDPAAPASPADIAPATPSPTPPSPAKGPATQALADAQAAKRAARKTAPAPVDPPAPAKQRSPARKATEKAAAETAGAAAPASPRKPRAPRKSAATGEAS